MIGLDSLKLVAPIDLVRDFRKKGWIEQKTELDGMVNRDTWLKSNKDVLSYLGLKRIELDFLNNRLNIELSSKILREQYPELINLNTIERVIDEINNEGSIILDTDFINEAKVHTVDTTQNISVDEIGYNMEKASPILSNVAMGSGYKTEIPQRSKNVIYSKKKSKSLERLIVYDKQKKLARDKMFKETVKGANFTKVFNSFNNVIRLERNITDYNQMRTAFNIRTKERQPELIDILSSKSAPISDLFNKITDKSIQMNLFIQNFSNSGSNFRKYQKTKGNEGIISDCKFDEDSIRIAITHMGEIEGKHPRTVRRYIQEVLGDLYAMNLKKDNSEDLREHQLITYIKDKLKVA